jgi:ribosomal protein S15P/S13E
LPDALAPLRRSRQRFGLLRQAVRRHAHRQASQLPAAMRDATKSQACAAQGLAPEIPEDLYFLIKKAVSMRKHLDRFRKDRDTKFRLILVESRIHRLARYYKVRASPLMHATPLHACCTLALLGVQHFCALSACVFACAVSSTCTLGVTPSAYTADNCSTAMAGLLLEQTPTIRCCAAKQEAATKLEV